MTRNRDSEFTKKREQDVIFYHCFSGGVIFTRLWVKMSHTRIHTHTCTMSGPALVYFLFAQSRSVFPHACDSRASSGVFPLFPTYISTVCSWATSAIGGLIGRRHKRACFRPIFVILFFGEDKREKERKRAMGFFGLWPAPTYNVPARASPATRSYFGNAKRQTKPRRYSKRCKRKW